ncbi:MAG: copper chaperone PCu(A)C [Nitrosomonadales bacterium]|nr:copper chaperone PCu(A)C [Nitrosomonadales bacterium]
MKGILCAGLLAMMAVAPAYADDVKVTKAWTRATAPGQDSASVQLTITSKNDATLVGAASGSAQSGELHSMVVEDGVMKMRAIESLPLPANTPVTLGADGNHLMLIGLKTPLKAGRKLPFAIKVKFSNGRTSFVRALAQIKPLETTGMAEPMNTQPAAQPPAQPQAEAQQHEHHHQ